MEKQSANRQPMWSKVLGFTILLAGLWATWWVAMARPEALAQASRGLFLAAGALTLLLTGLLLGSCVPGRRQDGPPSGGDDLAAPQPPTPDADPIEVELQRIITEEQARA